MFDAASPELLLRFAIIALPALVLLVLFFLLQSNAQSRRRAEMARADADDGTAPLSMVSSMPPPSPAGSADGVEGESLADLEGRLAVAEEKGEPVALAHIYLALGRARIAGGDERAALEALRSCAGLAALHRAAEIHAQARIELAEAAFRAGDLTSACEHWQMARMAFLDGGHKAEGDRVDRRMRANGCPTDWVLTDF